LLESELFGYEEGAFSGAVKGGRAGMFESAQGGTVFLDEIGDMPLAFQTRLLRILEDNTVRRIGSASSRKVDFRLLAASNVNLQQAVEEGRFREDLYFRLNEMLIHIPPLRERTEDIGELAGYFLRTTPVRVSKSKFDEFLQLALPVLQSLPWPGNIRQLKNVCRRAAVLMLQESDLSSWRTWFPDLLVGVENSTTSPLQHINFLDSMSNMNALALAYSRAPMSERTSIVRQALNLVGGEVNKVAEGLGISRSTVWRLNKGS